MGFRFRKSFGRGPFRINISKSGIGYSIGTKGVRFTRTAKGTKRATLSIPGTGISYVSETKKNDISNLKSYSNKGEGHNMKKIGGIFKKIISWFGAFFFLMGGLCFSPSVCSIYSFLLTMLLIPINAWQKILSKVFKKAIKITVGIALFIAMVYTVPTLETAPEVMPINIVEEIVVPTDAPATTPAVVAPTPVPTKQPVVAPTNAPTGVPTKKPTSIPTVVPTKKPTPAPTEKPFEESKIEVMVWVTNGGSVYHSNEECSNMKSPYCISLEDAEETRRPCKKCY